MLTHAGVFSVDFSRIDTGKTVCFLASGGLLPSRFARFLFCFAGDGVSDVPFPVIANQ